MRIDQLYRRGCGLAAGFIFVVSAVFSGTVADQTSGGMVQLNFRLQQHREVYEKSSYGEAPQFAIWLQTRDSLDVKTLFVTRRTAQGKYVGKVECPVSLPIWIGIFRRETGRADFPTPRNPFFDAVTGATPQTADIRVTALVEAGKSYDYYIEMNVAGDYNSDFPRVSAQKHQDKHGNGQPSLVWRGTIEAVPGASSTPALIGRSHQYYFITEVAADMAGIGSAREVFSDIAVECTAAAAPGQGL